MNREDPIVDEVRATRERLVSEAGGFDAYVARLKVLEATEHARVVFHIIKDKSTLDSAKCAEDQTEYRK